MNTLFDGEREKICTLKINIQYIFYIYTDIDQQIKSAQSRQQKKK